MQAPAPTGWVVVVVVVVVVGELGPESIAYLCLGIHSYKQKDSKTRGGGFEGASVDAVSH